MPPALPDSDIESDASEENIPATKTLSAPKSTKAASKSPLPDNDASDAGDDDDASDAGVDEYVVEKIMGHRFVKGKLEYDVKWQGYDNPKDRTWEPEDNMEGAADVLAEYHEDIGGRPEPKGTKRKAGGAKSESGTPAASSKRGRPAEDKPTLKVEKSWSPPLGSWEHDVSYVDTVEELSGGVDPKTGERNLVAYVVWKNQKKTQHPLRHLYQKCPQKMLTYYETHLVFTPSDLKDGTNGDTPMKGS